MADEAGFGKALVYKSDTIFQRRRRILREARKMISEVGLSGFSIRELCARAGIAQRTLYNAYGSKERVIALAIEQYMKDFSHSAPSAFALGTLEQRLETLVRVHSRNIQIREYTTAIMAVYNSPTADKSIRNVIRNISEANLRPFARALEASKAFVSGVTAEAFVQFETSTGYAVLTDWCLGELDDDNLVDRMAEAFLMLVVGMTEGESAVAARRWLEELRGGRPDWLALRRMAEVGPGPEGEARTPARVGSVRGASRQ